MKVALRGLFAVLLLGTVEGKAGAHVLGADCFLKEGRLCVEAFFNDDSLARGAKVRVLDAAEKSIAEGRTDNSGKWSVEQPPPGIYTVLVDAGGGHQAKVKITIRPRKPAPLSGSAASMPRKVADKQSGN